MTISYATATANARLVSEFTAAVSGQTVDGGSGVGQLVIGTASLTTGSLASNAANVLATIALQKPSVSIASKVATLLGVPLSATASATGTAALANLYDSAGGDPVRHLLQPRQSAADRPRRGDGPDPGADRRAVHARRQPLKDIHMAFKLVCTDAFSGYAKGQEVTAQVESEDAALKQESGAP